ncbi:hypothetical protein SAMN05446037_1006142 [Anaerovirgula multivorans]|uniref:Uncharacterized protein n=1 Tax=Anaerovirgula multivorans TaxID=312168 RepID=A0A239CT64_9FIRM|nr:hypothetical protein [Anaerovirgula multivorans]SNS23375.1 hypothetical protein SAMN05446037_1006142 [Anaerovirgula multivorans]
MICPKCGGELRYIEEVIGSFTNRIYDDGFVDFDSSSFYGDKHTDVMCTACNTSFDFEWVGDLFNSVIKLKGAEC